MELRRRVAKEEVPKFQAAVSRIDDYDDYFCLERDAEHGDVSSFLGNFVLFHNTTRRNLPQDGNCHNL